MAQQTAVMAIAKAFRNWQREWDRYDKEGTNKPPSFDDFVKPFLQMEKEQIVKAHNNAVVSPYTDLHVWETNGKTQITKGEQYYNETYGKIV